MLPLQETQSIHDSMNLPKIEFITYIWAKIWKKGPSGNKSQKWDIY